MWKHGVPRAKRKLSVYFETAKGCRIAIDISTTLHPLRKEPKSALLMACMPPYPPTVVAIALSQCRKSMMENQITPCYVLEGCKHPMKFSTHQERLKTKTHATENLNVFYPLKVTKL